MKIVEPYARIVIVGGLPYWRSVNGDFNKEELKQLNRNRGVSSLQTIETCGRIIASRI